MGPWGSYQYPTVWSSDANGNLTVENVADSRRSKVQSRKGMRSGHRFGARPERRRRMPGMQGHVRQQAACAVCAAYNGGFTVLGTPHPWRKYMADAMQHGASAAQLVDYLLENRLFGAGEP